MAGSLGESGGAAVPASIPAALIPEAHWPRSALTDLWIEFEWRDMIDQRTAEMTSPTKAVRLASRVTIAIVTAILVFAMPGYPPAARAATAGSKCSAYAVLITARGWDAPKGTNLRDGRVWLSGGHGSQLSPLVSKMKKDFGAEFPVWTESLAWTAGASSGSYYEAQVNSGMRLLVDEINSIIKCPVVPKILLAGTLEGQTL